MKKAEILAPAGGMEQLVAAVRCGADAVYLGSRAFNARMGAENFDDLKGAVSYCHARGVRVYVTFNTLFTEGEKKQAEDTLRRIAESGADAVLATDLGAVRLMKACCPAMPMHASTQMTVHSPRGVLQMRDMGFSRVVLARELTREEIRACAAVEGIETEVFVHGALCMSVSGQCFLSSVLGGRSGNRGQCAQPCRLDFSNGRRGYALSLKDLSLMEKIRELESMGVASLKIEGRLKRPEYVAAAVTACLRAREGETPDMETLERVFSRSGFTSGYYTGQRDERMFGVRTGEDAERSRAVLSGLRDSYRREYPRIPVDLYLTCQTDRPVTLSAVCEGARAECVGPLPVPAEKTPLTAPDAEKALGKLGGTPFWARRVECRTDEGLFVPASVLGALRREAAEQLSNALSLCRPWPFEPFADAQVRPSRSLQGERLAFLTLESQLTEALVSRFDRVYLPLRFLTPERLAAFGEKLCGRTERFLFGPAEEEERALLASLAAQGLKECAVSNPAGLRLCLEAGVAMYGEATLGLLNSLSLKQYLSLGLRGADLSFENPVKNLRRVAASGPCGMAVYGKLPLMSFRSCPLRGKDGCGACPGGGCLSDRTGERFPIQCHRRQYSVMLNARPLYMGDRKADLPSGVAQSFYFTDETAAECLEAVLRFDRGQPWPGPFTRALYTRELK